MKNYIKEFIHWIKRPINSLRLYHQRMKDVEINGEHPYRIFILWLLDVVEYGFIITFCYVSIFKLNGIIQIISLILSAGMVRWLLMDTIKEIKKIMNGDNE